MKQFSVSDAAVTGFRVAREQPRTIAIWAGLYVVVQLAMAVCMVSMGGQALTELMALSEAGGPPDTQAMMALYGQIAPLYGAMLLIAIPFYTVSMTAAYRVVLRPSQSSFGYLRLGAEEARQFVVILVLGIVLVGAYFVAVIVATLLGIGVGAGLTAAGAPSALGVVVTALLVLGVTVALWTPLAVRLSLAGPQTLAEGRIRLFDSWRLTKDRFWPMLGAYLIALLLALVVTILGFVIALAVAAALGGGMGGVRGVFRPDMTSLAAYFSPTTIVYLIVMSVISAMGLAITLTPPAVIYRDIAEPSSSALADTFSD